MQIIITAINNNFLWVYNNTFIKVFIIVVIFSKMLVTNTCHTAQLLYATPAIPLITRSTL